LYKEGNGRTYLAKNVMSTARYKTLLQRFPDAKIIYIARHPYEVIPSTASMFTLMYDRSIPKNAPPKKVWAQYALDFFRYSSEMRKTIPAKQFIAVKYDDLMQQPQQTVEKIYSHFNWIMDEPTQHALMQEHSRAKHYKSGHQYSLEEYGFTRVEIKQHLKDEMDAFGFE